MVYANLTGPMAPQARGIIDAMQAEGVKRLIFISSMPFRGHDVSLNSLSDLIAKLATSPGLYVRSSLGVSKGESDRHVSGWW